MTCKPPASLLRALVAALAAILLGMTASAAATVTSTAYPVHDYTYNSPHLATDCVHTTAVRGPPASCYHGTTYDTVDHRSRSASARSDRATPATTNTYGTVRTPAQVTNVVPTAQGVQRSGAEGLRALPGSSVAAKTADDWPILSGIVRDAGRGKGNFGVGSGTASQATRAGESWVGEGYRIASDGKTLVSRDGLRTFRPPSWKPDLGKYQANFSYWIGERVGKPFGNGHLDITDMGP